MLHILCSFWARTYLIKLLGALVRMAAGVGWCQLLKGCMCANCQLIAYGEVVGHLL